MMSAPFLSDMDVSVKKFVWFVVVVKIFVYPSLGLYFCTSFKSFDNTGRAFSGDDQTRRLFFVFSGLLSFRFCFCPSGLLLMRAKGSCGIRYTACICGMPRHRSIVSTCNAYGMLQRLSACGGNQTMGRKADQIFSVRHMQRFSYQRRVLRTGKLQQCAL